jgi:hypothetical protein
MSYEDTREGEGSIRVYRMISLPKKKKFIYLLNFISKFKVS